MPGAGSCYKREVLIALFNEHSGCRNGEDRETTILGIKNGYRTFYMHDVLALTRPPLTFNKLLKQRIRWNLGYLETFAKERKYYFNQIFKLTRVGIITLSDILFVIYLLLAPFLIVGAFIISLNFFIFLCAATFVGGLLWSFNLALFSGTEYKELNKNLYRACFIFPFFKLSIESMAWIMAVYSYYKTRSNML
jgi:cellulose synthase/poly-beta-1,6-N-acetylglucosamine synthase-like glycosyltransferase